MQKSGTAVNKRLSLSVKLILISVTVISVVFAFHTYLSYCNLAASIDEQYRASANSTIKTVNAVTDARTNFTDLTLKDEVLRRYMANTVLSTLIALLVIVFLLYSAFNREVFKPLQQLIEGAHDIAQGNLEKRIDLDRADEFGQLSWEFDKITEALQRKEKENSLLKETLKEKQIETEAKAYVDHLTQLENHRSFQIKLEAELNRSSRLETPASLLFCDLDGFKAFNDAHGHLLGDKVLVDVAQTIKDSIRDYDAASRYGGEEFAIILANTDSEAAVLVAERIRAKVEKLQFNAREGVSHVTISVGVATYPRDAKRKELLIAASDYAMYESKNRGGNAVTLFKSSDDASEEQAS
ncbi:MAG: GGDEF domain-containing protein [Candidatus Aquicultor sp.]